MAPGSVSAPRPAGRLCSQAQLAAARSALIEHVLGRIAGLDGDRAVLGQQQDDPNLQHQGDLVGRGPEHVVEGADAGELAAEDVERLGRARPCMRGQGLSVRARAARLETTIATIGEEHNGHHVARIGDGESVERRHEEEIVAERRRPRWRRATATSHSERRWRRPRSGTRGRCSGRRSSGQSNSPTPKRDARPPATRKI